MSEIRQLHWGTVAPPPIVRGFDHCTTAIALWPSPVNADACFAAAGFHDFADPDKTWDTQWTALLTRLLRELETLGRLNIIEEAALFEENLDAPFLQRLAGHLVRRPPLKQTHLSPLDQLLAVTNTSDATEILLEFGTPPKALLRAGSGHPILWIGFPTTAINLPPLLNKIADTLPLTPTALDWPKLLPPKVKHPALSKEGQRPASQ